LTCEGAIAAAISQAEKDATARERAAGRQTFDAIRRERDAYAMALQEIAGIQCGIPGHSVAVGCRARSAALTALRESPRPAPEPDHAFYATLMRVCGVCWKPESKHAPEPDPKEGE
jgi:hypothetical protein